MKFAKVRKLYCQIRGGQLTLKRTCGSVFLGLFIGLLPLYGLHLPLCLGLSFALGLDGLIAYAAANISNPFFAPFIVMLQIEVGSLLFTGARVGWDLRNIHQDGLSAFTLHSLVGVLVVAVLGACLGTALTLVVGLSLRVRRKQKVEDGFRQAIKETLKRYQGVRSADKHYVQLKLLTDPLSRQLEALHPFLGHVTDVGCGRGQFALLLMALGKAGAIYGFDWDPVKVGTAQRAASDLGKFVTADLREPPLLPTDTVLLFDVLHYLSPAAQSALLARIVEALRPNGRLLLRDVDRTQGFSAALTRFCERVGTRLGMNRSDQLVFRSSDEIRREILALGFELESDSNMTQTLLSNRLWVFRKTP